VGRKLLRDQVGQPDLDLLGVGVAGKLEHLHPVAERGRDGVQGVGGGQEEHLREVESHAQVVVHEAVVLGRVQHLQQG
jgi:hypothetical protein